MYTVALYDDMMARIRATVPDAAVSSDFIVGFCGEDEDSFQRTVALVERSRFKNSFIFKYSPRAGTKADSLWADDVPEDVKRRRNNELLAVQNAISVDDNRAFVGRTVEVLVEGPSKASQKLSEKGGPTQLTGRTTCDRVVVFDQGSLLAEGPAEEVMRRPEVMTAYLGAPQAVPAQHCPATHVPPSQSAALWQPVSTRSGTGAARSTTSPGAPRSSTVPPMIWLEQPASSTNTDGKSARRMRPPTIGEADHTGVMREIGLSAYPSVFVSTRSMPAPRARRRSSMFS